MRNSIELLREMGFQGSHASDWPATGSKWVVAVIWAENLDLFFLFFAQ